MGIIQNLFDQMVFESHFNVKPGLITYNKW